MGKFSAAVKGGLHANYSSTLGSIEQYNFANDHKRSAQSLAHKGQFEFRGIVDTLILSGVGATATVNYAEIEPNVEMGGKRNIIQTPIINRAINSLDLADARETLTSLSSDTYNPNPPINGDHNPLGTR